MAAERGGDSRRGTMRFVIALHSLRALPHSLLFSLLKSILARAYRHTSLPCAISLPRIIVARLGDIT